MDILVSGLYLSLLLSHLYFFRRSRKRLLVAQRVASPPDRKNQTCCSGHNSCPQCHRHQRHRLLLPQKSLAASCKIPRYRPGIDWLASSQWQCLLGAQTGKPWHHCRHPSPDIARTRQASSSLGSFHWYDQERRNSVDRAFACQVAALDPTFWTVWSTASARSCSLITCTLIQLNRI